MLLLSGLFVLAAENSDPDYGQQTLLAADRFVDALEGKQPFEDADFHRPLGNADQAALGNFKDWSERSTNHPPLRRDDGKYNLMHYARDTSVVVIIFDCPGVAYSTPVGVTLQFEGTKISQIELHNADLMEAS